MVWSVELLSQTADVWQGLPPWVQLVLIAGALLGSALLKPTYDYLIAIAIQKAAEKKDEATAKKEEADHNERTLSTWVTGLEKLTEERRVEREEMKLRLSQVEISHHDCEKK